MNRVPSGSGGGLNGAGAGAGSAFDLLTRSMHLLTWWRPAAGASAAPIERLRTLVHDANAAMLDAGERQTRALTALNEELPALLLGAAKARDPQALLEAELAIAARIRRCAAECCEVWSGAAAWKGAPGEARPKTDAPEAKAERGPDRAP
ncbi:MAG: hypothetical protein JNJ73_17485 [Hyphomonadaceae bacterium]|nr:hypothetical protein [Hyphomonadaceae bacterium]